MEGEDSHTLNNHYTNKIQLTLTHLNWSVLVVFAYRTQQKLGFERKQTKSLKFYNLFTLHKQKK